MTEGIINSDGNTHLSIFCERLPRSARREERNKMEGKELYKQLDEIQESLTNTVIIDGVNVAGCNDYREVEYKEMPICMNYYNHLPKPPKETEFQYCAGNKNCHYKQLKRLEQENKEIGRKAFLAEQNVQTTAATFCEKDNKIIELEQENKELKSDVLKWQKAFSRQYQINENKGYSKAEENCRSALEKINLILDELKQQYDYMTDYSEIKEIQNKINEVLNV